MKTRLFLVNYHHLHKSNYHRRDSYPVKKKESKSYAMILYISNIEEINEQ